MRRLFYKTEFSDKDLHFHLEEIKDQINYLKNNFQYDSASMEFFNWIMSKLNRLSVVVNEDVRFDYLTIQGEIDRLYKIDNSITGVQILFDFIKTNNPKRAILTVTVPKSK
ncbi:hypothetical protein ES677_05300 [Bizionia gelidisalsuginis]|uniref:Uncharacterized protein n=1 Tax=Bizionia gelidisalsuginis TaxID=291188 RepID=A0ABY3MBV3_9FLAO|nr:hypothetical protein [Bizionia gelidisalsuginis]TYC14797.1 hypothetical protein ES677_05300 [Bizionia gelidisalsuginis]